MEAKLALEDAVQCLVVLARERSVDYIRMLHLARNKRCRAAHSGLLDKRSQNLGFLGFYFAELTIAAHDGGDICLHAAEELQCRR